MFAAAEVVAIFCEPTIKAIRRPIGKGKLEDPAEQSAARKNGQQLLDRSRTLPGSPSGSDQLHRVGVCFRRNPGETGVDAGVLRRNHLDLVARVPPIQQLDQPPAHLAGAVVDHGVEASRPSTDRFLAAEDEAHDGKGGGAIHEFTPAATWMLTSVATSVGCSKVLCTGQSAAARSAAFRRPSGSEGQSSARR